MSASKDRILRIAFFVLVATQVTGILHSQAVGEPQSQDRERQVAEKWIRLRPADLAGELKIVQSARVFVVEEEFRGEANQLLEYQPSYALEEEERRHLMRGVELRGDQVAERAIAEAEAELRREGTTFAAQGVAYANSLRGRLKPYLIRAVAANHGGTRFGVSWHGMDLCVFNGSLGSASYQRRPLIVYLEDTPKDLWIEAATAK